MKCVVAIPKSVLLVATILTLALFTSIYPISQWKTVFASPDTLTLRPNAAGTYQAWGTFGAPPSHWEGTSDQNDATGVQSPAGDTAAKETENLQDTSQTGTINSVTAYMRAKATGGWKVQSGTGSISTGSTYTTVNIDSVNLSKSFLLVNFGGGIAGTQPEQDVIVSGSFSSASQLRFDRIETTDPANFGWYVIEALGTQISVQSGTTQFASTETQKDVTITDVTDASKCVIFLSSRSTGTDRTQYNKCFVTGELTSATNLRLGRQGTGTIVTVEWFVVKFNDGTTIQTGETAVSTSNPTIQSITSVDLSRTWLYFTWRATANGLAQVSPRGWLESSTEIRWFRQTTTGICYIRWFVIQMPSGTSVQRGYHDSTVKTEYTKDITITPVALNRTFSFTTNDCAGTGNYFPRSFWIERITTTTNLHLERWYTGQTSDHNWQIIELPPAEQAVIVWRTYNTDYESSAITIDRTSFTDYSQQRIINPNTGSAWTWNEVNALEIGSRPSTVEASEHIQVSEFWIVVDYTTLGYNLNLRVMDWDLIDAIANAQVCVNNSTDCWKTSDSNGWANYTGLSGTVTVKVQYFGFWVNGTFSVTMDSDKTINVQCKLYDVTVLVQEGVQNAYLASANVTVYNSTSVQGNTITSGVTGNNGQVQLLNLPNNTLTFTQYGGASYSLVIGNNTQLVSSENQTSALTANQNNINTNNNYSIIAFAGMTIPLKGGFVKRRLKKKRNRDMECEKKRAHKTSGKSHN